MIIFVIPTTIYDGLFAETSVVALHHKPVSSGGARAEITCYGVGDCCYYTITTNCINIRRRISSCTEWNYEQTRLYDYDNNKRL